MIKMSKVISGYWKRIQQRKQTLLIVGIVFVISTAVISFGGFFSLDSPHDLETKDDPDTSNQPPIGVLNKPVTGTEITVVGNTFTVDVEVTFVDPDGDMTWYRISWKPVGGSYVPITGDTISQSESKTVTTTITMTSIALFDEITIKMEGRDAIGHTSITEKTVILDISKSYETTFGFELLLIIPLALVLYKLRTKKINKITRKNN